MTRNQRILLSIVVVVAIMSRPVKVYCDIPGRTCTSQSITGQYQTTRYQIQPWIISGIESLLQKDTRITYRRGSLTEDLWSGEDIN